MKKVFVGAVTASYGRLGEVTSLAGVLNVNACYCAAGVKVENNAFLDLARVITSSLTDMYVKRIV